MSYIEKKYYKKINEIFESLSILDNSLLNQLSKKSVKDINEIDLKWYKKMIENYVQGAFGLSDIAVTEQTGLDAWM